jgi:small conductance mechanosensitive channel
MGDVQSILGKIWELITVFGLKIIAAIAVFIVGRWISKLIKGFIEGLLQKAEVEQTLRSFAVNLSYVAMMVFVVIAALGQLGIQTTSFVAILGAAGLAIGLALQGSLSNFAAGVMMIIFRPFKVGDVVKGSGITGLVKEIQIFCTIMESPDGKSIIVPNSKLTGDIIINNSPTGIMRVDLPFTIAYASDIDKTRNMLMEIIHAEPRILKDPAPAVVITELVEYGIKIVACSWVKVDDYWGVYFDTIEKMRKAFHANNILIPYPQRDVHLYEHQGVSE